MTPSIYSTGVETYDIVAAVYRCALADTHSKNEQVRSDAIAFLDVCCPDWREQYHGSNNDTQRAIVESSL